MRIDLTEQLGNGQFVEIKDPKRLSWREQKDIVAALKDESAVASLDVAEKVALALVRDGYVLDDNNKPIAFPLTSESVLDLPAVVIEEVSKAFAASKKEVTSKN